MLERGYLTDFVALWYTGWVLAGGHREVLAPVDEDTRRLVARLRRLGYTVHYSEGKLILLAPNAPAEHKQALERVIKALEEYHDRQKESGA